MTLKLSNFAHHPIFESSTFDSATGLDHLMAKKYIWLTTNKSYPGRCRLLRVSDGVTFSHAQNEEGVKKRECKGIDATILIYSAC